MKKFDFKAYTEELKSQLKPKAFNSKKLRQSILIVCEGKKTEPLYFESFKKRLPKEIVKQVTITGKGMNTTSLITAATEENGKKENGFDQTWIVMDRDSFTSKNVNDAHHQANILGYKMAYSDESFELWYLLHFIYLDTPIDRNAYIKKLNFILNEKGLPKYSKASQEMYSILEEFGNQNLAIKYSKKLEKIHSNKTFANRKPSTSVYKLVDLLNEYIF